MYGGTVQYICIFVNSAPDMGGVGARLSVIGCLYVCICTEYVCEGYVCMYVINHTCMYIICSSHTDQDEFSPLLSFDRKLSYVMIIINNFDSTLILEYLLHL